MIGRRLPCPPLPDRLTLRGGHSSARPKGSRSMCARRLPAGAATLMAPLQVVELREAIEIAPDLRDLQVVRVVTRGAFVEHRAVHALLGGRLGVMSVVIHEEATRDHSDRLGVGASGTDPRHVTGPCSCAAPCSWAAG